MLAPAFWPEVRRGTERVVHELCRGLPAQGFQPHVITSHRGLPQRGEEEGVPVVRVPRPPSARLDRRVIEPYVTHLPFSYAALSLSSPDLAHAWYPTDALVAARWRARTGRPAVHSYMGIPDHAGLMYFRKRLDITRRAIAGTDVTVALSHYAAGEFERWLGYRAEVISPPVDVQRFTPGGERSAEPSIVCAADAREPRKRVELLVAAFARVRRRHPTARLLLDARTASHLADESRGVLAVSMTDLPAVYRSAWVSALPSFGEAFGLVLAEAMACGTPGVGTAAGGITEVVSDGVGALFTGGEEELAQALLEGLDLAQDPATADRCRERATAFSTDRVVAAYADLYRRLTGRGSASSPSP